MSAAKGAMLYENDQVKMYVDEDVPCLVNEWHGFLSSDEFRSAILKLVDLLEEHAPTYGVLNMLADTRKLNVVSPRDLEWINQEVNSRYVENGAHFEAFVVPEEVFGESSVKRYIRQTTSQGLFTVQLFDSMEKAKAWLREVHESPVAD